MTEDRRDTQKPARKVIRRSWGRGAAWVAAFSLAVRAADPSATPDPNRIWGPAVEPAFPFFSSVLDARGSVAAGFPADNLSARAVILNLGWDCWAAFDLDLLRMAAIWEGAGVSAVSMSQGSYHAAGRKAPEGEDQLPRPSGTIWIANGLHPGWQTGTRPSLADPRPLGPDSRELGRGPLSTNLGRFRAVRWEEGRAVLEYDVEGTRVRERVSAEREDGLWVVRRRFSTSAVTRAAWLMLGRLSPAGVAQGNGGVDETFRADLELADADRRSGLELRSVEGGRLAVRVPESKGPLHWTVALSRRETSTAVATPPGSKAGPPVAGGVSPWKGWKGGGFVVTKGVLAGGTEGSGSAYVLDDVPLPVDNPWRRNVRLADIGFLGDGEAVAVTFDGDVWRIGGLQGDLARVTWRRFASGLHEPLGLAVRLGEVFVHDRNGLWRLPDRDGDGEADAHELVSNAWVQTAETREYATGLRVLPDGDFVIAQGGQRGSTLGTHGGSVLRVPADGGPVEVLGHGLRQPFIGVHPRTGWVTASDQQGHYTPSTPLHWFEGNRFHGFLAGFLPKERYPEPIADPLTWIPHPINPSGAGQVWLADARMGLLNGSLIHLGYYRPEIFVVRWHQRSGRRQAAVMSLTRELPFAPLAGSVNPTDGQLYVTGFQIWGTVADRISGLARLRDTGRPDTMPTEVVAMDRGVLLRFNVPLDPGSALDPAHFSAERWNYRRSADYGSPHFRLDGTKGQDAMTPSSAYLSVDGRSVFVGLPDMKPVMQMRLGWTLSTAAGGAFTRNAYFTAHELPRFDPVAEGFPRLQVDLTPRVRRSEAATPRTVEEGKRLAELMGCVACHSSDGTTLGKVGPTWKGLFGKERSFADGGRAVADEDYLRESIREPARRVVSGFEKTDTGMPSYEGVLTEAQVEALVMYLRTVR